MTTPQGYLDLAVGISCTAQAGTCPAVARVSCSWLPREVFASKLAQIFSTQPDVFMLFSELWFKSTESTGGHPGLGVIWSLELPECDAAPS